MKMQRKRKYKSKNDQGQRLKILKSKICVLSKIQKKNYAKMQRNKNAK